MLHFIKYLISTKKRTLDKCCDFRERVDTLCMLRVIVAAQPNGQWPRLIQGGKTGVAGFHSVEVTMPLEVHYMGI